MPVGMTSAKNNKGGEDGFKSAACGLPELIFFVWLKTSKAGNLVRRGIF